ncbi:lipid IV(A) 3-deoxy-D-manno-octulosonic acid transferase [Chitiniphilus purpureus]|uniref:3-deoxy-D-manno-octulosonic acid transferase n=1 Tax=Chitiniphilus purpureus TaxID=2981137 RepID=A0ABY6DNP9_9NEIS|nr:lipid IV(A) 3-deoxy-D-manno-octulosonic acid transferase [Chitiniphilus sp. CD1]UXY15967.1 lipid IV(A) 3-deoxy-D-manno-octulosonic acid transferase [Chitiniphilus sp. CD1]
MTARVLYSLFLYLVTPLAMLYLLWRSRRQPAYRHHWHERWARYGAPRRDAPLIWLHAVSVGETRAAVPLVQALRQRYPDHRLLLTAMTPTGRATAQALFGGTVELAYLPYDYPGAVRRFLRHYRPAMGMLLETEVWPNLVAACRSHGVPLFLVNARLSEKSYRGYARLRPLVAPAFGAFAGVLAQHEDDAARLRSLGAREVQVIGNLKFDNLPAPELVARGQAWRAALGGRPVLLLASSRDGEEALLLDALARTALPDALLIVIVPRHPQRFDAVAGLLAARGLTTLRRSGWDGASTPAATVLLGDSMGEMTAWYALADVAIMGGSLLDFGCQNLIEACAVGAPVLLGPSTYNFAEVARAALGVGCAWQGQDADAVAARALQLLRDPAQCAGMREAGLAFAGAHRGATMRVLERLPTP